MNILCWLLLALVGTQAFAQYRAVQAIFITDIGSCKSACDASMRTWQRLLRQIPGEEELTVGVYARDSRPATAVQYARELGIPLVEQCSNTVLDRLGNMSTPILALIDQHDQCLVVDNLSKQPIDRLSAIIRRFVNSPARRSDASGILTKRISQLDSVLVGSVQSITDSNWLILDQLREAAVFVDVIADRIDWSVTLPERVRLHYRTSNNAVVWDAYTNAGVRMTEVSSVFPLSISADTIGFSLRRFDIGQPQQVYRDGHYVGDRDLVSSGAIWRHFAEDVAKQQSLAEDEAKVMSVVLWSPAAQYLHGTSVVRASNVQATYADSNEREVAAYINQRGVHLLFRISALPASSIGFDPSHYVKFSAMHSARVAVCSPGNEVLGIYDTTTARFFPIAPVGPLHELLNRERVQNNNAKNYGLGVLVDTMDNTFLFITFAKSDSKSSMNDGAVAVTVNAYDVETGQHLYQRSNNYENEQQLQRMSFHSVRHDELWGLAENKEGVYFVRIKR